VRLLSHTTEMSAPVTRREILDAVGAAFTGTPASAEAMLTAARDAHARPETITVLQQLPPTHFRSIRDLWAYLPDVPVN
jgi:hypothetical protein